jgi:UDP-N-acetylglucosamine 3-dehydrogenase
MDHLRVAVVGLGIGRRHVQAYQTLPDVEVVAIADTDAVALEKTRQEFGIRSVLSDFTHILTKDDIDLVSICTPDRLHAEQVLLALEAGKHVLCEKPMATCLEDAARIVQKVRETGLKFMVGHNYRFVPQFARLKQLVDSRAVGDLFYGESGYIQDLYFMEQLGPDYWRLKDPQDFYLGGAVHNVDLLRWIVGEIEEVHTYSNHVMPFYPLDDNYVSNFRFANGCIGRVLLVLGARLKDKFHVDLGVYGSEGSLRATLQRGELVEDIDGLEGDRPTVLPIQGADSHALEIAHFVECVREDRQPLIEAADGARTIAVCLAAIRSTRESKPIAVDYSSI